MITVLKSDKSGDKKAILLRVPNALMTQLEAVVQGDLAPGLVKLLEIGLSAHKVSGENIVINVEPPQKKGRVPEGVPAAADPLEKELDALMTPSGGFGRKRK